MPPDAGNALLLALGIIALSFIAEDGATVLAVSLAANDLLRPELAFIACFAGIWIGDLGLYGAARWARGRFVGSDRLLRAEQWFHKYGNAALIFTRFVPGTRAATYATAGALRTSLPAFAIITGLCAIFWVGAAFLLARYVGLRKLVTSPAVLLAAAAAIVIWLARPRLRRLLASMRLTLRKYSRW